MADVVVVGAGFAGLTAARELVKRGHDVVVLEGRDRVGGRSYTTTIADVPVDLGGAFVGPTQVEVLKLAAELGCRTVPTYHEGKNLIHWRGRVRSYRSTIPHLSIIELLDVSRIQWRFERLTKQIPLAEPWTPPVAHRFDDQTLDSWLRSVHAGAGTRDLMAIMARVTWGCEPDEVSLLHAVRYVKAAGGLGPCSTSRVVPNKTASQPAPNSWPYGWPSSWATESRSRAPSVASSAAPTAPWSIPTRARRARGPSWWPSRLSIVRASRSSPHCPSSSPSWPSIGRRAGSARPSPPTPPRSGGPTAARAKRCPTTGPSSSPST